MCVFVVFHQTVAVICFFIAVSAYTRQDDQWIEKPFSIEKFKVYQNLTSSKQQAGDICRSHGAALPEPRTRGEISFLAQLTNDSRTFSPRWLWLGMTRTSAHVWAWDSDGAEVDWSPWQHVPVIRQPEDGDNCSMFVPPVATFGYSIFLAYFHCAELGGVVCQKKDEFEWISKPYSGQKFKLFMKWMTTYNGAVSVCEKHGAFLPEPKKSEDIKLLGELINATQIMWIWLGMTKHPNEGWIWNTDGSAVSWAPWEELPGSRPSRNDTDCTILFPPAKNYFDKMFWKHYSCKKSGGVICQKEDDWIPNPINGQKFTLIMNSEISYENAVSVCKEHGSFLPEPRKFEEIAFLGKLINASKEFSADWIWLGMTKHSADKWIWYTDGTRVSWSPWKKIPSRGTPRDDVDCTVLYPPAKDYFYSMFWAHSNCSEPGGVVCQKDGEWVIRPSSGQSYRLFSYPALSYKGAISICKDNGAFLPEPKKMEEILFIGDLMNQSKPFPHKHFWVGMTKTVDNTWIWNTDGSNVSWSWELVRPENDSDPHICMIFQFYQLSLQPCDEFAGVVCQKYAWETPASITDPRQTTDPGGSVDVGGRCSLWSKTSKYQPLEVTIVVGLIIILLIVYKYGVRYRKSLSRTTTSTDDDVSETETTLRQRFYNVVSKALRMRHDDNSSKRSEATSKSAGGFWLTKRLRGFWSSGADRGTDLDLAASSRVLPVIKVTESNVDTGVTTHEDLLSYEDQSSCTESATTEFFTAYQSTNDSTTWTTRSSETPQIIITRSPDNRDTTPTRRKGSTEYRQTTPTRRKDSPEYRQTIPTRRKGSPEYRQTTPTRRTSNHLQVPLPMPKRAKKMKPVDQGSSSPEKQKPRRMFMPWLRQH